MFQAEQQIGNYFLIRCIGRGGFGEVWLAERRTKFVTTKVAVKLPHNNQIDYEIIKREAVLWEQASGHPNVLPIIEADEYDEQIVIVSEYAPDGSLDKLLEKNWGQLPIKQAIELTVGILNGLEYLHSKNIIHRDIKPANILLHGGMPRLADFGISRLIQTTKKTTLNNPGSPDYMSPEAFHGNRHEQADIWSVGVILYQTLTGSLPFQRNSAGEVMHAIINDEPAPLPPSIPSALRRVVIKSLTKNPNERFQTANEMREDLNYIYISLSKSPLPPTEESVNGKAFEKEPTLKSIFPPKLTEFQLQDSSNSVSPTQTAKKSSNGNGINLVIAVSLFSLLLMIGIVVYSIKTGNDGNVNAVNQTESSNKKTNTSVTTTNNTPTVTSTPVAPLTDNEMIPFRNDKLGWGFSDKNKNIIIAPSYEEASPFYEGLAKVCLNKKCGFIDNNGKEIVPLKYSRVTYFSKSGFAQVCLDDSGTTCGLIDKVGQLIVPFKYASVGTVFSEGLSTVGTADKPPVGEITILSKLGFVDEKGIEIISPNKYGGVTPFSEGLAAVSSNGKCGFIDKTGQEIIPLKYDRCYSFSGGVALVVVNYFSEQSVFINKSGEEVSPRLNFVVGELFAEELFSEELAVAQKGLKKGFIDKKGNIIIPFRYYDAYSFSQGMARIRTEDFETGKYGFIDKTGKEIIPIKYNDASNFSEDLVAVKLKGKWGFIDKFGNVVIPLKYDWAWSFHDSLALVTSKGKSFYIDKNGTEYYEP